MKRYTMKGVGLALIVGVGLMTHSGAYAQVAISEDGVTFPDDTSPVTALKQYELGDVGPAGGRVFYVTADGLHGLEAARDDTSTGAEWGCAGTIIPGANSEGIGMGASNTEAILQGCETAETAALLAAEYVAPPNGYFDWYLPSVDEIDLMYNNIGPGAAAPNTNIGGFVNAIYWSSTEDNELPASNARPRVFSGSSAAGTAGKTNTFRVRAIRAF